MLIPLGFFGGGGSSGAYEQIATSYGTGSSGIITFSSIPSTYSHLQLRMTMRGTTEYAGEYRLQFNGDTNGNYSFHTLVGDGSSMQSLAGSSTTYIRSDNQQLAITGGLSTANSYAAFIVDILNYASTSKNKTTKGFGGKTSASYSVMLNSGSWQSTAAINQISILNGLAGSFTSASRFSLYGIRG